MNSAPQSKHFYHFPYPPNFLYSSWKAFPLHHTQPLSIIDLSVSIILPFPDCHINRMMEYGVFLCQPLLSIEHLRTIMSLHVLVICPFITGQFPNVWLHQSLSIPQTMGLELFPGLVIMNKQSYTRFDTDTHMFSLGVNTQE